MAETHVAETKEVVNMIIGNLKSYKAECTCKYDQTFLPKYSVKLAGNQFEIKVWYVCANCGRER